MGKPKDRNLDAAVRLICADVLKEPSPGKAVAKLARTNVTLLALIKVWRGVVPELGEAYDLMCPPEVKELIELHIKEIDDGGEGLFNI